MQAECVLKPRQKLDVKEKQILKNLLTQEQVADIQCGNITAIYEGTKLSIEDEVKGTVLILTPLQAG